MNTPPRPEEIAMYETMTCPECGGTAHLLTPAPAEGFTPGDVLVYRCADCGARWDVVYEDDLADEQPS